MKELVCIARNIYQTFNDKTEIAVPGAEIVITVSEPKTSLNKRGDIISKRKLSDFRFACSPQALQMLALTAVEIVEDMGKLGLIKKKEGTDNEINS